ncbi:hypothetical protein [Sphingomonas sp. PvP018]|uniref:hypothetical protein n=1 Tax=Sphingomonas sp. PvP018 TaxID=2817852 RepID=UPI001AE2899C|nr:hypothetical protein [Sphingomonas sp. PvP018]MBP2513762.1 hypothetical protein [Sphingomonas sp. PvP018]
MIQAHRAGAFHASKPFLSLPAAGIVLLPAAGESIVLCGVTISAVEVTGADPFYLISTVSAAEGDHRG